MLGDRHTRRTFLRTSIAGAGGLALGAGLARNSLAAPATTVASPYGALGLFDTNGIALPPGFSSRLIAKGLEPVGSTGYTWHKASDGMNTFPEFGGDGWYLCSNSEQLAADGGGVSVIRFSGTGTIVEARRLLTSTRNCSSGTMPAGTYLTCEEYADGLVYEVDPTGAAAPVARPALGTFQHEAACYDDVREQLYLTEDQPDGLLYRFTPTFPEDLSAGLLEAAVVNTTTNAVTWSEVPRPNGGGADPTRYQVPAATKCSGGEGMAYDDGIVYFSTKGDRRIWRYDVVAETIEILYELAAADGDTPLREVDNLSVSKSGDLYVCEDGNNFEVCMITPDRYISAFARLDPAMHGATGTNEVTGVTFDPSGTRLYFSAQRSFTNGAIYEISGPFRLTRPAAPIKIDRPVTPATDTTTTPSTTTTAATPAPAVFVPPPAPPAFRDTTKPRVTVTSLSRSLRVATFLKRGLSVRLDISEPVGIDLVLRATGYGVVARHRTTVAVSGLVRLRLRAKSAKLRKRVRRRRVRTITAQLTIRATDRSGNVTTTRRRVRIIPPH